MHGKQTSGLFHRKAAIHGFDMEMSYSGIPFIKKILLTCHHRPAGGHRMHLCTSTDHPHLYLSVRKPDIFGIVWVMYLHLGARLTLNDVSRTAPVQNRGWVPGFESLRTVTPRRRRDWQQHACVRTTELRVWVQLSDQK